MNPDCGIYSIKSPSGREYIGSAVSIKRRWRLHVWMLEADRHHCPGLRRAAAKYGADSFRFSVIELTSPEALVAREQHHIDTRGFRNLYNANPTAGNALGRKMTTKTKEQIASKLRGRIFSPVTVARQRAAAAARRGSKASPETIAKLTAALRGHVTCDSTKQKISAAQIGKPANSSVNTSGHIGVQRAGPARWRAQYGQTYLGNHRTAAEAAAAIEAYKASGAIKTTRTCNTSGFTGVHPKGNRWIAETRHAGKRVRIGSFLSPDVAFAAIQAFKAEHA